MIETTSAPRLSWPISASFGRRTFRRMSAASASAAEPMRAPAAAKSASGIPAVFPAPLSTTASAPRAMNFLTVSGLAATRFSCGSFSATTPINMTTSQTVSARPASAGTKLFQNNRGEPEQKYDRRQSAPPVAGDGADAGRDARDDQADQGDEAMAFQTPKNETKND